MLFSIYFQSEKFERSSAYFGEPLKHVITLRWQILLRCVVLCVGVHVVSVVTMADEPNIGLRC